LERGVSCRACIYKMDASSPFALAEVHVDRSSSPEGEIMRLRQIIAVLHISYNYPLPILASRPQTLKVKEE